MLFKLSLTGIKGKLRDYLVLFSGLVMASAIFYMFESMATNKAFLESNSIISSVVMIFHLGSVLLAIITLVYILYANSFLMTMRQKDYAMFMMLGAKGRKIAQLIFVETLFIGILATIAGSAIGIGLSSIVNQLLTKQLDVKVTHFSPFNTEALMITFIFFIILFLVSAVINAGSMIKKPILNFLWDCLFSSRLLDDGTSKYIRVYSVSNCISDDYFRNLSSFPWCFDFHFATFKTL